MGKTRSKAKKFFIYTFVILFLGAFALGLWWLRTRTALDTRRDLLAQIHSIEALMSQSRKENIALLSAKYGLEPPQLEQLLDAYLSRHDVAYRMNKELSSRKKEGSVDGPGPLSIEPDTNFGPTLETLSVRYNLPKERLAGLIADYKVLSRLEGDNAIEAVLSSKGKESMMKFSLKGAVAGAKRALSD